jgi:hypothetical protein
LAAGFVDPAALCIVAVAEFHEKIITITFLFAVASVFAQMPGRYISTSIDINARVECGRTGRLNLYIGPNGS